MFQDSAGPGLRALFFLLLSLVLIVFDQRSSFFHTYRSRLSSYVSYPFEWTVDAPVRFVKWLAMGMITQQQLLRENDALRVREILLQSRLQKLLILEKENTQLRELLQSTSKLTGHVTVARLLAVSLDPNVQQVILNKGKKDHVYDGQPVLDAYGVMGQIISIGSLTSKVLLITDEKSAVPVEDYRNGMRAIAVGQGTSGKLTLINVSDTSDIVLGDKFVTSGLGLHYPVGYPVGVVTKIEPINSNNNKLNAKIILTPAAHINQTEQVLLSWSNETQYSKEMQKELENT